MASRKRAQARHEDPVVEQLDQIKRLLMLGLIVSGIQAKDIATVLGVHKSTISGLVPARAIKKRDAG